jgi:hypothetical protein
VNAKQRIDAAAALEAPDRALVAPLLDHYAATHAGITNAKAENVRVRAMAETGRGWGWYR